MKKLLLALIRFYQKQRSRPSKNTAPSRGAGWP